MEKPPTRARILKAATRLFQARGYHAVGVNEILEHAEAPKGSLYHHFPAGKGQIAQEAVARVAADVEAAIRDGRAAGRSTADILRQVARGMGAWLERSSWREGCLVSVVAQETAPDDPTLTEAVEQAYAGWRRELIAALAAEGRAPDEAAAIASLAVATLEGGLILARVDRAAGPFLAAVEWLAQRLEQPSG